MKIYKDLFNRIISLENLVSAWEEFRSDKGKKIDVQEFEFSLEQNIFSLHRDLVTRKYTHGPYTGFYIRDPKVRHIHKATVRDRVLHHAVFRILNPIFEETFIPNSFSCRIGKGTHKGVLAAETMLRKESRNYTVPCYALKCDVRKFFDSVDHEILLAILKKRIADPDTMWLVQQIVRSFTGGWKTLFDHLGLPIGNLTSQLFANVYMNEFDQFVKQKLKVKHYARYTDDFVVISTNKKYLEDLLDPIQKFLNETLKLTLHPKKISIRIVGRGVDYLGYVILPHHLLLRSKTKHRIFRKLKYRVAQYRKGVIDEHSLSQSLQSYLGALSHADTFQLSEDLKNQYWYWIHE
jgi:retron-type reverse transcriptase